MVDFSTMFFFSVSFIVFCALVGHWLTLRHERKQEKMKHRHEAEKLIYEQRDEDDDFGP